MDIKEFASRINGRQYGNELTKDDIRIAKENGIVVVYGASDDLMEFEGAIYDEAGVYNREKVLLDKTGLFEMCEDDCIHSKNAKEQCKYITAKWGENGFSWSYETDIPHETFLIYEDDELYCQGIVFYLSSLK